MSVVLLSFADSRYEYSLKRIEKESADFPIDEFHFLSEKDLPMDLLKIINPKLYRRGFGYWRWKPYIVLCQIEKMKDGDILIYSDAGITWNPNGIERFVEYVQMLKHASVDYLVFQQPFLEKDYNKWELLHFLNVVEDERILMSLQIPAGLFMIKKSPSSISFLKEWQNIMINRFDLISDKCTKHGNLSGFIEHRHDQSVFSILVKKREHIQISWNEIESLQNNYESLSCCPFHVHKTSFYAKNTIFRKLKSLYTLPYRLLIGYYLKYCEGFYFFKKVSW